MRKKLDILGLSFEDTEFLKGIIEESIGEELEISTYAYNINEEYGRDVPVVLISGSFLLEQAKRIYPNSKIIAAKRIITGQNLEKVMLLPANKKVMVANYPEEVTLQTIESLKEIGLTHLNYIPYWPGVSLDHMKEEIDTAISPGHIYICPEFIKEKIDLGRRTISFSTFMELLMALDLDIKHVDKFAEFHIKMMVNSGSKIAKLLLETERLSKNMSVVLDKIKNGIISIDDNDCISVFNPWAEKILGIASSNVIGMNYKKVFKEYNELVKLLDKHIDINEAVINIRSQKYVGTLTYIFDKQKSTRVCTLNEVSAIQKMEQNLRRNLYSKGYIAKYSFNDIKGSSSIMKSTISKAKKFAKKDLTVLIHGESGTGKELFAQSIHNESDRAEGPFIAVNFAALHENIVESELFGYEEGAFTGATKGGKPGLFEQAHKGTIFLDEIGDAPQKIQSKLLRVLQEHEVMRLGASKIIPVDIRVIAATNKDLKKMVDEGTFREDLYYRLKVLSLEIPPLRNRHEDIYELIKSMIDERNLDIEFSKEAMQLLIEYDWPGNIRELENVINYLCAIKEDKLVEINDLPEEITKCNNRCLFDKNINNELSIDNIIILEEIYSANKAGRGIGRKALSEACALRGINLSEANIRTRLKKLTMQNYVYSGKTKQGIFITQQGIKYIKNNANRC